MPIWFRETTSEWISCKLTFNCLPHPESQFPAQPFLVERCRVVLHLSSFTQPTRWRGEVQCPPSEMCSASSCWTSLSGAETHRHKMLNSGSSEVLRIFYKAICILLSKADCTWPALAAVHQRDACTEEGREGGREGAEERFLIRLLSRRWCLAQQACFFQGYSWEFIFFLPS